MAPWIKHYFDTPEHARVTVQAAATAVALLAVVPLISILHH